MDTTHPSRILMAIEFFPPHWTGLAKAGLYMATELAREHSVTVLTTRFNASLPETEHMQGVRVIRAPYLMQISRSAYSPQTLLAFVRLLRECDHVILHSPHSNIFFLAVLAKLFFKRVTIFHQGDFILPKQDRRPLRKFLFERIFDLMTLPAMALADRVGSYTLDYGAHSRVLGPFPRKRIAFIPRMPRPPSPTRGELHRRLKKIGEKRTLIGFAGRFVEEKGFDILLQAIPLVAKEIPGALFVFAGETNISYEKTFTRLGELIKQCEGRLELLGLLHGDSLWEFYRALDVFVLSSRSDCFPLTQMEAALCGVPIVVTDIPGCRMLVKETGFGEIVPPESPEALAAGIVKVAKKRTAYLGRKENVESFLSSYEKLEAA